MGESKGKRTFFFSLSVRGKLSPASLPFPLSPTELDCTDRCGKTDNPKGKKDSQRNFIGRKFEWIRKRETIRSCTGSAKRQEKIFPPLSSFPNATQDKNRNPIFQTLFSTVRVISYLFAPFNPLSPPSTEAAPPTLPPPPPAAAPPPPPPPPSSPAR